MKNSRAIITLFIANAISGFAQGISMLSIPWFFAKNNSSSIFNLVFFFVTFFAMIWGLFAGTLIDRYNRKMIFVLTQIVQGVILISVVLYAELYGGVPYWGIVIVFTATAFGFTIHYPTMYAFIQEITSAKNYTKVTSAFEIIGQFTSMLAGASAAFLLDGWSNSNSFSFLTFTFSPDINVDNWSVKKIFFVDGITYFLSSLIIMSIKYKPVVIKNVDKSGFSNRIKLGFLYLKNNKQILVFGFFSYAVFVVLLVETFAVLPMYIHNHLQQSGIIFGLAEMLYAFGAILAGLAAVSLLKKTTDVDKIILSCLMISIAFFVLAVFKSVILLLVFSIVIGISNASARIFRMNYLFNKIENNKIGRVNSVFNMANILARLFFIGLFSIPFFSKSNNIIFAYLILGGFTLFSAIVLIGYRKKL